MTSINNNSSHGEYITIYEEVEISKFDYDHESKIFTYPCPCGDLFYIELEQLLNGEDIAGCDSCTLLVQCIYSKEDIEKLLKKYEM